MKLSSRLRRTPAEAAAPAPDGAPPPPTPPHGNPVAAYAGILDGQTLWLAVDAVPGTLALRDGSGKVHVLRSDLAEDDPAYRSIRVDLRDLAGDDEASYDVVLVPTNGRAPRPVWTRPFDRTPMRTPRDPSGRWQFSLARTDEGMLQVRRGRPEQGCDVLRIDVGADGIRLTLAPVDTVDPALLLLDEGEVVVTYPVVQEGDDLVAVLTEAPLPEGRGQLLRLGLGSPEAWVPLRRWANGLANPNAAVLLPPLHGADPDVPRLRLRYAPDGTLAARVVDPSAEGNA